MVSEYRTYPQRKATVSEIIQETVSAEAEVYEKQFFVLSPGDSTIMLSSSPKQNSETVSLNGVIIHSDPSQPDYTITNQTLNLNFEIETGDLLRVAYVQG
jgi:hypothetical protein